MGREIRRVPADWVHPIYESDSIQARARVGEFRPLFNRDYDSACVEWYEKAAAFKPIDDIKFYHDYNGNPPDKKTYRDRAWTAEEATHYQMYETVSEGTPVSPVFATKEDLVQYLIKNGDYWDQKRAQEGTMIGQPGWNEQSARKFVQCEFAFTMIVANGIAKTPRDQS